MGTGEERNFVSPFDGPVVMAATDPALLPKGEALPADPSSPLETTPVWSPKKGLERYHPAELTSAMQKYVRRGEAGKACAVARAMIGMGPEAQERCIRRLPIIAGEDSGWQTIAPATWAWKTAERLLKEGKQQEAQDLVVTTIGILAKSPKSGDPLALWSVVRFSRKEPIEQLDETWPKRLREALDRKDEEAAARIAVRAMKKATAEEFWKVMRGKAAEMGFETARLVESAVQRLAAGMRGGDEGVFVAGAVLGLCRFEGRVEHPGVTGEDRKFEMESLDWCAFDLHTWVGKRAALAMLASGGAEGLKPSQLGNLQFYVESLKGKWGCPGDRWFDEAADWELEHMVKIEGGAKAAFVLWEKLGPKMKQLIEVEMSKGGRA